MDVTYHRRGTVDDAELSLLHARAFGAESEPVPWSRRLERHSLTWITAIESGALVGFVNIVTDGGAHCFLLDTVVSPDRQGLGIGRRLVAEAVDAAREGGCQWLHVDYEDDLHGFYAGCGFRPTSAGLLRL
ncbi:MAG: GNAT family N-acetyltransferase [Stackebrandtia sp.]